MTSDRPYRKGLAPEAAFVEVEKNAGRQFDPAAAHAFLAIRPAILTELEAHARQASPSKRNRLLPSAAAC
jgi:HD-GYP domain-containing protein (c-di-GMP phosphodiesterase class II)